jgi:3-oxoacyl-[acyl-carrier-protein] synthase-3
MSVVISGIGKWLPEQIRTNAEWPSTFGGHSSGGDRTFNDIPASEDPLAAEITARDLALEAGDPFLGSVQRHVADDSVTSAHAETLAARAALSDAGISGSDVDLVLSYTICADELNPQTACHVAGAIGARSALGFNTEAACATTIIQIEIARAYLESGLARAVLLTQSHLILKTMPLQHPATPGLGDAATALVLTRGDRGLVVRSTLGVTHGEYAGAISYVRGRTPEEDPPWWREGGPVRVGARRPDIAKLLMRETVSLGAKTVRDAAARASVDVERINALASVQPRGFIPHAIAQHLGLARDRAVTTYTEVAHIGASGPVYNLARARDLGRLERGSVAALYAQGAGFTRAAAIVESV